MSNVNKMIITNSSLSKISRLLIDKRIFDSKKIEVLGSVNIINGIAGGFNKTSYLFKKGLELPATYNSFEIQCNGTYTPKNPADESCLWSSFSTDRNSNLYLSFLNDTVTLYKNNEVIVRITNLVISETNKIQTSIKFHNIDGINVCSISLIVGEKVYTDTVRLEDSINFQNFTIINVGIKNTETNNFWQGNIDIPSVALSKDNIIEYTPSVKNAFRFTKVMLSDGTVPLTDDSVDLLDHVYSCEITEISRNNNNILLTANVGENIQISLREIGLYFTDDNPIDDEGNVKEYLFSTIKDISVLKNKKVEYNLIIHVNIDINVVNTVAFPEIVVKKGDNPHKSDFQTIKDIFTYITTNMERMIKTNALGIGQYNGGPQSYFDPASMTDIKPVGVGYDYAQKWYRFLKDMSLFLDNSYATNSYGRLLHRLSNYIKRFNPESIEVEGNTLVYEDGTISSFSINSYAKSVTPYTVPEGYEWDYKTSFSTGTDVSTHQYVVNFSNETMRQPLLLEVTNEKCQLSIGATDEVIVSNGSMTDTYYRVNSSTSINGLTFYPWYTRNNIFGYNPHVELIGPNISLNDGILTSFSGSNYAQTLRAINPLENSWELTLQFTTGYDTENYIHPIICNYSVDNLVLYITNKKLNLTLQGTEGDGTAIPIYSGEINSGSFLFEPLTTYTIVLSYDRSTYKIIATNESTGDNIEIFSLDSSTPIMIDEKLIIGSNKSNGFAGSINLNNCSMYIEYNPAWEGVSQLTDLFTRTYNCEEDNSTPIFYDSEGYEVTALQKVETVAQNFIVKRLFNVKPNTRYYVKIHYFYGEYSVEYSTDGNYYVPVLQGNYTSYLQDSSNVFYGIAKINGTLEKPFMGSIFLQDTSFTYYQKDSLGAVVETTKIDYITSRKSENELLDFFHIPTYAYDRSLVTVNNLNDSTSHIDIFEGTLKGGKDSIDFSKPEGFTLVTKFLLNTQEDKLILAKGDLTSEHIYFTLEQKNRSSENENNELVFSLFLPNGTVVLTKEVTVNLLERYTRYPITVTITCDGNEYSPLFNMYINTELVSSYAYYQHILNPAIAGMYLTNRLSYADEIVEDQVIYDVLSFKGVLSTDEILLINTILGTNP